MTRAGGDALLAHRRNMRGAPEKIKLDTVTPLSLIITPITSTAVSTPKAFGAGTPLNAISDFQIEFSEPAFP